MRVRAGALQNAPNARMIPAPNNHRGLAEYWGTEAAGCLLRIANGTSTNPDLDADHAWRTAKIAHYRWKRYRNIKGHDD